MKVLLVGGGGREHAIAWKLRQDNPTLDLLAAPGNPGIASIARCVPVAATDLVALASLARAEHVAFTFVGPEAPLAEGIVDRFRAQGLPIFGPSREAARIETSKRFSKDLMQRANVPTARARHFTDAEQAHRAVREFGAPVVVKASGLAAGKGVVVCETMAQADEAIDSMLLRNVFGASGAEILVEEFMEGEELSLFAMTDGTSVLPMLPVQDHKRLCDGDSGPNTGGMGAYAPVSVGSDSLVRDVVGGIIEPVLAAMREHGTPFTGLLYAGLMLTEHGPKVVEFNCRFGDPETEAILPLMESSLLDLTHAVAVGDALAGAAPIRWRDAHAVTTVVASPGYPQFPRLGDRIVLPAPSPDVLVFHAGTRDIDGALTTAGGRVLAVTAVAGSLGEAAAGSARFAGQVRFEGPAGPPQFRRDIGWRELTRHAGTP